MIEQYLIWIYWEFLPLLSLRVYEWQKFEEDNWSYKKVSIGNDYVTKYIVTAFHKWVSLRLFRYWKNLNWKD